MDCETTNGPVFHFRNVVTFCIPLSRCFVYLLTRNTNSNATTSGYSSLTDSQFVFGSKFWPENSQSMSQEMSFPSRNSQQSFQEVHLFITICQYHGSCTGLASLENDVAIFQKGMGELLEKYYL